jgi:hypothetical protein
MSRARLLERVGKGAATAHSDESPFASAFSSSGFWDEAAIQVRCWECSESPSRLASR